MRLFEGYVNRRIQHKDQTQPELSDLINYETSPMRWTYDALLAEYSALRSEIVLLKEQMERTHAYLLTLLGGVLASQLIDSVGKSLNQHPWIYLVSALLALWFPVNNLTMSVDMIAAGKYLRDINAVRINSISKFTSEAASSYHQTSADAILGWPGPGSDLTVRDAMSAGPMNWEEFIAYLRPGRTARQKTLMFPVYVARIGFLYSPTLLLVGVFVANTPHVDPYEIVLIVATLLLMLFILIAGLSIGSVLAFNTRTGLYRNR